MNFVSFVLLCGLLFWLVCWQAVADEFSEPDCFANDLSSGLAVEAASVTFVTTVPPGRPDTAVQALRSWALLVPRPEIIVFGNEEGADTLAADVGARHVPDIGPRHPGTGLPLVRELFARAEAEAKGSVIVYANADIIFTNELILAIEEARSTFVSVPFLLVGKRHDLPLGETLVGKEGWQTEVRRRVARLPQNAKLHNNARWAIDYFAWQKGFWQQRPTQAQGGGLRDSASTQMDQFAQWPALVMGVPAFDNWILHTAVLKAAGPDPPAVVIDASHYVPAFHQRHSNRWRAADRQAAKQENERLAKAWFFGNLDRTTHYLQPCDTGLLPFQWDIPPSPICIHKRHEK